MASLSKPTPQQLQFLLIIESQTNRVCGSPVTLSFPLHSKAATCSVKRWALKTGSDRSDLLRKPVEPTGRDVTGNSEDGDEREEKEWVDWEDQILEDTVPLVNFVRMILHSGKYENGDRLSPEHERTIVERLLPYHPESDNKIGCGIDYIKIGYHPDFDTSRCLFIVRKDGQLVDFSYWKCIKGLIKKNYPLYADSFILRHFRRRRRGR